jgi:glucose-fructose oxidoreductase
VFLCPPPAHHADWVERVAEFDVHVLLEKPFATSVAEADRMIAATADRTFAVNWPLAWYPSHRTTKRLVDEGTIGDPIEVHYYDGNRGSDRFADVVYEDGEITPRETDEAGWWHRPEDGGGSLHDYLGYGVTLGTWFRDGELPETVSTETYSPDGVPVDTHSATVARYASGLSTFETRWGTFTDPWEHQPQPSCGFVVVGTEGTIRSDDYAESVRVQTTERPEGHQVPVDELRSPTTGAVEYVVDRLERDAPVEFEPLNPQFCREVQRIVDAAVTSAEKGCGWPSEDRRRPYRAPDGRTVRPPRLYS